LRAGSRPQLQLYFDGKSINAQTQMLIQAAITSYSRNITNPQPPVEITTTVVNTSPTRSRSVELSKVYIPLALLVSLVIGTTFMPQLLIEEKEKKTLRMLMVTPTSFEDILIGKLIVVLAYQLILTGVVLVIQNAFKAQGGLVMLYALVGGIFSVAVGLLFGAVFNTISAATAAEGPVLMIYILAGIFVGPLGDLLSSSPVTRIAKLIPTYYIAEGVSNATQNLGTPASHLLDIGVVVGSTLVLLAISAWALRRQSAIAAMI
jgi:ABC-2 type transport system permease protein